MKRLGSRTTNLGIIFVINIVLCTSVFGDGYINILPQQMVRTPSGIHYGIARRAGFLISDDGANSWIARNDGLEVRQVYPFEGVGAKALTSITFDYSKEWRIAVTSYDSISLSNDMGHHWERIATGNPIRSSAYFTSTALSPTDESRMLLGTSFSGIYESIDGGESWISLKESIGFLYRGAGFYEEISSLAYLPDGSNEIIVAAGFGNGLYLSSAERTQWQELPVPMSLSEASIRSIVFVQSDDGAWLIELDVDGEFWRLNLETYAWTKVHDRPIQVIEIAAESKDRMKLATNKFGTYASAYRARGEYLNGHFDLLKTQGLNSVVVDVKNDQGLVTYSTKLELPHRADAVSELVDIGGLISRAHAEGIYVIGRLVVFQDPKLYAYNDFAYASWDDKKDSPWGNLIPKKSEDGEITSYEQREFWVDPFSEDVWRYNIAIAEELQEIGIDEIQFDYIRFPSDGDVHSITYRHGRSGMSRIEALESFLSMARERIHIPISTDLYGFNSWYRMGNWIGQNIDMLAEYVDVICPMYYPSHFPRSFIEEMTYFDRAKQIYQEGSNRSAAIVNGRAVIRPYVQAFLIGGELKYEEPEYSRYLREQLEGTRDSKAAGFSLWNASNNYYMITEPLEQYFFPAAD